MYRHGEYGAWREGMTALTMLVLIAGGIFLFLAAGLAQASDVKSRMRERLPAIITLKNSGIVGENNQGFLEYVHGRRDASGVVEAENRDRQEVYAAIALREGTTVAVVGRRRALQIAERASPGEWIQDPGGQWRQR